MKNTLYILLLTVIFTTFGCSESSPTEVEKPDIGVVGDANLPEILEYIRHEHGIPALGAVVIHSGQIVDMGVAGIRAKGHDDRVSLNDQWHFGSLTKSMTSTLAGVLVDKGIITWDLTVEEVFTDFGNVRPEYNDVRLDELLSHTAAITQSIPDFESYIFSSDPLVQQRLRLSADALALAPEASRGTYLYSNSGYIIAGAMMEVVTGMSWEALMKEHVFDPLGMSNTGFGAPGTPGRTDTPWGHWYESGSYTSIDPGSFEADNPAVVGPAGRVHSTLSDMGTYMADHLAGALGQDGLLPTDLYTKLHTPMPGNQYALGWIATNGVLVHDGSNDRWLAQLIVVPAEDLALLVVANAAEQPAAEALQNALENIQQRIEAAN